MNILEKITDLIEGNKSVRKVSEDIRVTSELILLVRMMFADGELKSEELENFKALCERAFGIPNEDVGEVVNYLRDVGYETTAEDAAAMFADLDVERKKALIVHMISIARADQHIAAREVEMIKKTAKVLGLTAEDIESIRG